MTFNHAVSPVSFVCLLASCSALLCAAGCGGSVNASASAKADTKSGAEASAEGDAAWDQVDESQNESETAVNAVPSQPGAAAPEVEAGAERALLGARHDVMLAQGAPATCQCVAVVLGQPADPGIVWTGRRPVTDPNSQLVIVLSSDGVPCSEAGAGASYMGYEKKDGNIIVTVEAAVAGRPVTHGAIIPRPDGGGKVILRPDGKIPYGRGKAGEESCALAAAQ